MKYMGSKSRHAHEIMIAMQNELTMTFKEWSNDVKDYIEPFVGGANMIDKIPDVFNTKWGNDINHHLIEMFNAVQNGWMPPDSITEEDYRYLKIKVNDKEDRDTHALIAFVGIGCSYSGKWFGGYARGNTDGGIPRNYCLESKKNLLSQKLNNIVFTHGNYYNIIPLTNSLIYCDPPYADTTKYKNDFDTPRFWQWCNKMTDAGHKVFVSEYNAPDDWRCIWSKEVNSSLTKQTGSKKGNEKLFTK